MRVFEQAASPRELGFGLALAPNAIAALRELGVADTVLSLGFQPQRAEFRRMKGSVLKRIEMPPGALGGPMLVALRPALHGALLDAVDPSTLVLGQRVISFSVANDRVALRLTDGATAEGDLLVGADGVASVVRRGLHPGEQPPRHSGLVAVRGVVHGALEHLGDRDAVLYLGPGVESTFIRASESGIYWYLSLAQELIPAGLRDPAAIIATMAPRFDPTFRAITSATTDIRADELFDRDPLPRWGAGPVTLLGDAAHPVLPQTGQGAAQAMVDAVTLARALDNSDVDAGLRAYERERQPKTAALLAQGRRTARLMAATNPVVCGLREWVLRALPAKTFARFYVRINRPAGTHTP